MNEIDNNKQSSQVAQKKERLIGFNDTLFLCLRIHDVRSFNIESVEKIFDLEVEESLCSNMGKFVFIFVAVLFLHFVDSFSTRNHRYPYYPPSKRQLFGDISSDRIGYQHVRRYGFPFMTREDFVVFPSVSINTFKWKLN